MSAKEVTIDVKGPSDAQQSAVATVPSGDSTQQFMGMIASAARDPNVDVSKMERLFAMMEKMEAIKSERLFNDAMKSCQAEMPRIVRDGFNPQTKSTYAKLDTIIPKITPIYTKHGFSISFGTGKADFPEHVKVTALVSNAGHTREYEVQLPYDYLGTQGTPNKTKIHGVGSTINYGRRYLTYLIFNMALAGTDTDGNAGGDGPKQQPSPAVATEGNKKWFLEQIADIKAKALIYGIDKAIIMPNEGLENWPLAKIPITKSAYSKLREEIEKHK